MCFTSIMFFNNFTFVILRSQWAYQNGAIDFYLLNIGFMLLLEKVNTDVIKMIIHAPIKKSASKMYNALYSDPVCFFFSVNIFVCYSLVVRASSNKLEFI